MKKPLFNQTERRIIYEGKTIYASIMKLHIAKKKFEKEFMKTYVGRFIEKIANYLVTILS